MGPLRSSRAHIIALPLYVYARADEGRARFIEECGVADGEPIATVPLALESSGSKVAAGERASAPSAGSVTMVSRPAFRVRLLHYCAATTSPENCMLLAAWEHSPQAGN